MRSLKLIAFSLFILLPLPASAASVSVSPPAGTFQVGGTFTITLTLDTVGRSVNAFEIFLRFPPDKLQVISPATGPSIASVWVGQPTFDNRTGVVELRGGVPGGIVTSRGVIASMQFRARGTGEAFLRIGENSKVLANDGSATDVLQNLRGAVYNIELPPPAGPEVSSPTHPDQGHWYTEPQVVLSWEAEEGATAYSYALSENPAETPDNISEGDQTTVTYRDLAGGVWYFHIKSLRRGVWGGTSHFAVRVDNDPPAEFPVDILPDSRTTQLRPVAQFFSTDAVSGVDRFEIKVIPLSKEGFASAARTMDSGGLFVEATSPYVFSELGVGSYDVIVRAYDHAGNYRDSVQRLQVLEGIGRLLDDRGIALGAGFVLPWPWVIGLCLLLAVVAVWGVRVARRRHERVRSAQPRDMLPADVKAQLEELKMYREKYAKPLLVLLAFMISIAVASPVAAQGQLVPPVITNVSESISNRDIFYAGGKAVSESTVLLHIQNLETGEVVTVETPVDHKGDWLYSHSGFLRSGEYLLWAQGLFGEETSPPSPQVRLRVETAALEFGASRLSYTAIYLLTAIFLLLCVAGLLTTGGVYLGRARKKRQKLLADLRLMEEKVRRGFAVLRKDIEAELALLGRKDAAELLPEEKLRAEELRQDIERISERVGQEIWELEKDAAAG